MNGDPTRLSLGTTRIGALSDGVFAVALTVLVLDLHPPELSDPRWWDQLWPKIVSFVVSFLIVSIYWIAHNNESRLIKKQTVCYCG